MVLFLFSLCKPCAEQGKTPPVHYTSLYVTLLLDWFGEVLVFSMISQHSHIKVQSLHQLSLYNSSYFYSYLWMHRLMQMQALWKAWLVSRATLQLRRGCCLLPSTEYLLFSVPQHRRAFRDHPEFGREKNIWTEGCLKNSSPRGGSHYPKVLPESHQPVAPER